MKRSWLAVALLVLSLAGGAEGQGRSRSTCASTASPIEPAAPPDFTCFNATANRWVSCGVKRGEGPGLAARGPRARPVPAAREYRREPGQPAPLPGDHEAQHRFEVTERGPERLTVDMVRLIHLTRPGDNARSLEGMLTSCATQPVFETPRHSWGPTARIEFAWDPSSRAPSTG